MRLSLIRTFQSLLFRLIKFYLQAFLTEENYQCFPHVCNRDYYYKYEVKESDKFHFFLSAVQSFLPFLEIIKNRWYTWLLQPIQLPNSMSLTFLHPTKSNVSPYLRAWPYSPVFSDECSELLNKYNSSEAQRQCCLFGRFFITPSDPNELFNFMVIICLSKPHCLFRLIKNNCPSCRMVVLPVMKISAIPDSSAYIWSHSKVFNLTL